MRLIRIANSINASEKFALNEITVVNVPEPAINGNAIGTTVAEEGSESDLKNSRPSTISRPRMNMTIEPATAKDRTSTPKIESSRSPTKRNKIMKIPEMTVALNSRIFPILCCKEIRSGIDPNISITANNVKVTVKRLFKFISC